MKYPGFTGGFYTGQSKIAADDRCVNWYPEKIESGTGKAAYVLYPTPGYVPYALLGDAPGRGIFSVGIFASTALLAAVSGTTLYTFFGVVPTARGTIADDASHHRVSMVTNGDAGGQLLISSGLGTHTLYSFDLTTLVLSTLTPQGSVVGFLDGFGLALDTDTSTLQWSAPEDFTSWTGTDVAQRNDAPDKFVSMLVHQAGSELWLFGTQSAQVRYNDAGAAAAGDFPFVPNPNVFITQGTAAVVTAVSAKSKPGP